VRHRQFEVAELGEQPARVAAVAPVGLAERGHALEVLVDHLVHPSTQQLCDSLTGALPIVLTPFDAFGLHGLHHSKRGW
jgi:hypothetical protein